MLPLSPIVDKLAGNGAVTEAARSVRAAKVVADRCIRDRFHRQPASHVGLRLSELFVAPPRRIHEASGTTERNGCWCGRAGFACEHWARGSRPRCRRSRTSAGASASSLRHSTTGGASASSLWSMAVRGLSDPGGRHFAVWTPSCTRIRPDHQGPGKPLMIVFDNGPSYLARQPALSGEACGRVALHRPRKPQHNGFVNRILASSPSANSVSSSSP